MAQKTLNAFVVIGGRVDNTFGQIGTALVAMGQTVDEVSQKLINFGKESVEVYRNYEDSMLDAQVALSTTYGRGTRELAGVMETLDTQATEWAASTIFHTDDVANAIAQAAHANWDLNMILSGIPAAMRLAQAGGMDLSEAVDFIIKSVNGAGLEFKDLTEFIDEWTFAANSSAGDVEQFGEAMLKMGNTMRFAGSKEELLTMLAILHDSGTVGDAAGTLLRNTMLRLIAPTKKAKEAMADLEISQEDIDEAMSEVEGDTEAAVARLEQLGFSVYDDTGKLKDFMTIFADLGKATEGMSDDEKYAIWSAIFPTKTITGGMALMDGAADSINGLYAALEGGDAAGYGEYAADTMMSGLTGSIETFESKLERLKQITGEALSGDVMYWTDKLGGFVDKVATLDEATFSGLVGGLEVLAGAGPGLIIAGGAFRFLGYALGTNAGRIALAAIAIAALNKAASDYNEAKFEENFGTMDLDTGPLREKLSEIHQSFADTTSSITGFRDALQDSIDKYNEASQAFSSRLLTDMLTENELTDDDLKAYRDYGEKMIGAVKQGLNDSADMSAEFWAALFKGKDDTGDEYAQNPMFQGIIELLREDYGKNIEQVEAIGEDLRGAITAAFDNDNQIDAEEYEKIKDYFRKLNELMAQAEREAQSEAEYVKRKMTFDKGQNLSYEAMMDYINENVIPQRQEELDFWEEGYKQQTFALEYQYKKDYAEANSDEERAAVDRKYNEKLGGKFAEGGAISFEGLEAELDRKRAEVYAAYDQGIMDMMETSLHESDLSDADALIEHLVGNVMSGFMTEEEARNVLATSGYNDKTGTFAYLGFGEESQASQAKEYWQREIEALGGREAIEERIDYYRNAGADADAKRLSTLLAKSDFYEGQQLNTAASKALWWVAGSDITENNRISPQGAEEAPDQAIPTIGLQLDENGEVPERQEPYHVPVENAPIIGLMLDENGSQVTNEIAAIREETEETPFTIGLQLDENGEPVTRELETLREEAEETPFITWMEPEATEAAPAAEAYTIPLVIEGAEEADAARSEMEAVVGSPMESFITFPDASDEASSTWSEMESIVGQTIDTGVGFPGALSAAIAAYNEIKSQFRDIVQHVTIVTSGGSYPGMAMGGRATEPVIYGEAGPEWFIPERHDPNTANLIAMAAEASGFSLAELAVMNGARMFAEGGTVGGSLPSRLGSLSWDEMDYSGADGGDGAGSGNTYDVHYAPVIHAENADGVAMVLKEDKKRLKKLLREIEEERELYDSVVKFQ